MTNQLQKEMNCSVIEEGYSHYSSSSSQNNNNNQGQIKTAAQQSVVMTRSVVNQLLPVSGSFNSNIIAKKGFMNNSPMINQR